MQNVQETNLAWALIEVAKPHLNRLERNYAFVTTGAGDTFAAIHHLLKLIAVKGIPLRPRLLQLCVTWLDSYACHDEEPYLRRLIDGHLLPDAIRGLTAACVNPLSTVPKHTELLWVNHIAGRAVATCKFSGPVTPSTPNPERWNRPWSAAAIRCHDLDRGRSGDGTAVPVSSQHIC
jgi:hypothetical protein